jgi:nitrogen regulatory protein P-II 1
MGQSMKFLRATVKPFRLDEILEALRRAGLESPTVTETKLYGQKGRIEIYRGAEFTAKFVPMLEIEAVVPSDQIEKVTKAIADAARTGRTGQIADGEILVFDLERAQQICIGGVDQKEPRRAA